MLLAQHNFCNILCKGMQLSPNGKIVNQTDHVITSKRADISIMASELKDEYLELETFYGAHIVQIRGGHELKGHNSYTK